MILIYLALFQNYPVLVASVNVCNVIKIRLEHVTIFLASVKNVSVKSSSCDRETLSGFSVTQCLDSQLSVHNVILMRLEVLNQFCCGAWKTSPEVQISTGKSC